MFWSGTDGRCGLAASGASWIGFLISRHPRSKRGWSTNPRSAVGLLIALHCRAKLGRPIFLRPFLRPLFALANSSFLTPCHMASAVPL